MKRGLRAICVLFCLGVLDAHAVDFLLTDSEIEAERRAAGGFPQPQVRALSSMSGPKIEVLSPKLGGPIISPVRIDVRFAQVDDAEVDPASLRVLYGMLRLDITDRVLEHAKLTKGGFTADNVALQKGSHRIFLKVSDVRARVREQEFLLSVE